MLVCNKNYAALVLNYMLKNSERTISVLETYKRDRSKNIITKKNTQKSHKNTCDCKKISLE